MQYLCQICNSELSIDESDGEHSYLDFVCRSNNHFFGIRVKNGEVTTKKIRATEQNANYYCKINYNLGISEIWKDNNKRYTIHTTPDFDYSNLNNICLKLKTYLTFL